ncbi:MAG: 3-hydroxyacyl-CoA dehydrogenase [Acidimicrobiaceae bacterium]|nr:3-hydroxyacyl-CoA dehydrogenase [Acidimicrobiaceae bacterium]|tara:strand:+ start:63799 stop:65874 length:2076 start_codon:yes stop_codon:yes gene_type:complete
MTQLSQSVKLEFDNDVALIRIDNPPVNALSHHVRQGLLDGMTQAENSDATAIVVICEGRTFIAGADITEFSGPPKPPSLQDAQDAMENCSKPVIAAVHGTALGGGLEVALCAHYRVGVSESKYGLPEVKLGLLPGAGGTQRLPRVTGAAQALQMMTSGDPISAGDALECGLIDEIVEDLESGAVAFARRAVAEGLPLLRIRDRDDKLTNTNSSLFDDFRASIARKTRGFLAPEYNIRCVEAAVNMDFDEGLKREQELFKDLMKGTQSKAQQYYFFAERAALKIPGLPKETKPIEINRVGILGAGTMGGGIAMNFANVGIPVTIVEQNEEALERGLGVVRSNYERTASRGGISSDDVETRMGLINGSTDMGGFGDCDLIIEAVFENMDLKKSIFEQLDQICKPGAVLASNTSALDINEIASATSRPESVIGMHFFSPANVMKMLEVVRGDVTSDEAIVTAMGIGRTIGKTPVLCGVCHGFVGNRMLFMRGIEAEKMILEGAAPSRIDQVLFDFGLPMGPFAMSDLAGLDIGWDESTSSGSTVRELLCESGRRGQKNGQGYYIYDSETRAATPDPEVEQIIKAFAERQGVEQREISDQEILERCLYPMINEGAKILAEGIAIRGSDVDVVWINGYGWPMYTGGPMFWADTVGLAEVTDRINHYGSTLGGEHWSISPLIEEIVTQGGSLSAYTN